MEQNDAKFKSIQDLCLGLDLSANSKSQTQMKFPRFIKISDVFLDFLNKENEYGVE